VDADCVPLWMYFALSVAVLGRRLETSFGTLGCSEARVLPCTCWCELSTQIFGEERRSLDSLVEQGTCAVGVVVASAAVSELGVFGLVSVVAVDAEQVAVQVPEQVIVVVADAEQAQVPFAEQVAVVAARSAAVELDAVAQAECVVVPMRFAVAVLLAEDVAAVLEVGVVGPAAAAEDVELGAVGSAVEDVVAVGPAAEDVVAVLELVAVAAEAVLAAVPMLLLVVKRLCWSAASDPICVLELLN